MTTTDQTIVGHWSVVEQQRRNRGEWLHEYFFKINEWDMIFFPNGRMFERFDVAGHPRELKAGTWARDKNTGIIHFKMDCNFEDSNDSLIVFDPASDGPWLYFVDDALHLRLTPGNTIAHHAHERHKLKLVG